MFARRILILLALFASVMAILTIRLARWQLADAQQWRNEARRFTDRHYMIPTNRGQIVDRLGRVVAWDVTCWELKIDYRALTQEDRWLTNVAVRRLKDQKVTSRTERLKRLPAMKEEIVAKLEEAPEVIGRLSGVPNGREYVLGRYNGIRGRVSQLRQDQWGRQWARKGKGEKVEKYDKSADGGTSLDADSESALTEERSFHTVVPALSDEAAHELMKVFEDEDAPPERRWKSDYPGIVVGKAKRRDYPYGPVAAHVIGTMQPIRGDQLRGVNRPDGLPTFDLPNLQQLARDPGNLWGYLPADDIGSTGIEAVCEKTLRGTRGVRLVELGQLEGEYVDKRDPVSGGDVQLTLDIELQKELTTALLDNARGLRRGEDKKDDHPVAVVVMRISDGEILAMVSLPTFDLGQWDEKKSEWILDEARSPMLNRATASPSPPGSTIKPLIAVAALAESVVGVLDTVTCTMQHPVYPDCLGRHGPIAIREALQKSCNIYFSAMGERLNVNRQKEWFNRLGLGQKTGIEIGEVSGNLARDESEYSRRDAVREAIQEGIGQGQLTVTPLQMANAYATILRHGTWVRPRVLASSPVESRQIVAIDPSIVSNVCEGMRAVVTHGTATKKMTIKLATAGKTGSAEVTRPAFGEKGEPLWEEAPEYQVGLDGQPVKDSRGRPVVRRAGTRVKTKGVDAWFVGYAPAEQPEYVVATIMETGGHGGDWAVPIFAETIKLMERHGYLPAVDVPRRQDVEERKNPNNNGTPVGAGVLSDRLPMAMGGRP